MATSTTENPSASSNGSTAAETAASTTAFTVGHNSLYVGELPTDVTEAMLFEMFSTIGPVASIRVCRDAVTRRSLGYAYVNYHNPADSDRALELLNYSEIKGKPCRIMWSNRDPSMRKRGVGNVFIKNLDKGIDSKALYDTFSAFGAILSCKVSCDENGSLGFGFVHFDTQDAADKAIAAVNGMLLNDKKVFVGHHVPRKERQSKIEELKMNFTNVFVKNLPENYEDEQLNNLFAGFGPITSAIVGRDEDGKSKGFGFVNFDDHESASAAVDAMNNKEVEGRPLFVGRAQKKTERDDELRHRFEQLRIERMNKYQGVNLYIKNLDEAVDEETLREEFSPFGTITSYRIMRNEKGESRGFAFVCYSSPEESNKAIAETNNKIIGAKPVYVALAQRRDARRAMLDAQYATRMRQAMTPIYGNMMYPGQMPPQPGMPPQGMPPQFAAAYGPQFRPPQGMQFMPPQYPMRMGRGGGRGGRVQGPRPQGMMYPQQPRGGYNNYRNQGPAVPQPAQMMPQQVPQQSNALTAAMLARMDPTQQRQAIGERLYMLISQHPLVQPRHAENVGKITGMLLEMEISELLNLIESPEALTAKVEEAVNVLDQYFQQEQQ